MPAEFLMPTLGADMEAATLVEWRVGPGDSVRRGDVVAAVETDKGIIDIEIFDDGTIDEILVPIGQRVPVGTVLARLKGGRVTSPGTVEQEARVRPAVATAEAARQVPSATPAPTAAGAAQRRRISPVARARASEAGIDLESLTGTGPGGAISLADVERAVAARVATPPRGMREAIATAMAHAKREIPHYYLSLPVDFTPAAEWLSTRNARLPVAERLLYPALILRAVAQASREIEGFNGHFRDGAFAPATSVHLGVAIALRRGGLVAPAILDAQAKSLPALMAEFRALVTRSRAGRLRASEFAAPTITVTSLGEEGLDTVFPIIHPPQVAMVGAGGLLRRPWVVGDSIEPRTVLTLSLAADHRVTDGRSGARFLARIRDLLVPTEDP